jgi:hypothetical protein
MFMTGEPPRPEVGLCARCRHARVQRNARGATFWRCLRADADPRFVRYPRLPVRECAGFERAPEAGGEGAKR